MKAAPSATPAAAVAPPPKAPRQAGYGRLLIVLGALVLLAVIVVFIFVRFTSS
jgi:hypothetical protein